MTLERMRIALENTYGEKYPADAWPVIAKEFAKWNEELLTLLYGQIMADTSRAYGRVPGLDVWLKSAKIVLERREQIRRPALTEPKASRGEIQQAWQVVLQNLHPALRKEFEVLKAKADEKSGGRL